MFEMFSEQIPFDGIWLYMEEPTNLFDDNSQANWSIEATRCSNDSRFNFPPYIPPVAGYKVYFGTSIVIAIICSYVYCWGYRDLD